MASIGNKNTFRVIAKYKSNNEITSYQIEDTNGVKRKITRQQLCFLIGAGLIDNFTLTFFKGKPILRSIDSESAELPEYNDSNTSGLGKYKISKELVSNGKTVGFEVVYTNGSAIKLRTGDVYKLVKKGYIKDVDFDAEDKNVLAFKNESELFNLDVEDINTGAAVNRLNVLLNMSDINVKYSEENLSSIGRVEKIAFEDDIDVLKNSIKTIIDSFSYGEMQIIDISRHTLRIGNASIIFDIRVKDDLYSVYRCDILNLIATVLQNYEMNTDEINIYTYNDMSQQLAIYRYKLR